MPFVPETVMSTQFGFVGSVMATSPVGLTTLFAFSATFKLALTQLVPLKSYLTMPGVL